MKIRCSEKTRDLDKILLVGYSRFWY